MQDSELGNLVKYFVIHLAGLSSGQGRKKESLLLSPFIELSVSLSFCSHSLRLSLFSLSLSSPLHLLCLCSQFLAQSSTKVSLNKKSFQRRRRRLLLSQKINIKTFLKFRFEMVLSRFSRWLRRPSLSLSSSSRRSPTSAFTRRRPTPSVRTSYYCSFEWQNMTTTRFTSDLNTLKAVKHFYVRRWRRRDATKINLNTKDNPSLEFMFVHPNNFLCSEVAHNLQTFTSKLHKCQLLWKAKLLPNYFNASRE